MIKTDMNQVPHFAVREATPARIDRLFAMPDVVRLPKEIRENGLIFAGRGSKLLNFERPSDIIAKVSSWFPAEVARARESKQRRFFGHLHLWGPYENWDVEPAAFLSLWNCMPQNAWLNPGQNPFMRRLNDGIPLYPIAARQSSYEEFDFGFCVRERSGYRPSWTMEEHAIDQAKLRKTGEMVTPVLRSKFARYLANHRCRGTGPDDCVLVLRLWASLAAADADLAAAFQALEADVAPEGALPELRNPKAAWAESAPADGQDRFDQALRRAAFLRAKLLSVLNAPQAWPAAALATTLHQLSNLRQTFAAPFVHRWYQYELDYRNDPINPWRVLDSASAAPVRAAIRAELGTLAQSTECEVFKQWFDHGGASLQTEYVLDRLRGADGHLPRCGAPDFEWLKRQDATDFRYVLYGYLALLEYLPAPERDKLVAGLTDAGRLCFDKNKVDSTGWLQAICEKGIAKPQTVRDEPARAEDMWTAASVTKGDMVLFPGDLGALVSYDNHDPGAAAPGSDAGWHIPGRGFRAGAGWWALVCDADATSSDADKRCELYGTRLAVAKAKHEVYDSEPVNSQLLHWSPLPANLDKVAQEGEKRPKLIALFKPIRALAQLKLKAGAVSTYVHRGMKQYPATPRPGTLEVRLSIGDGRHMDVVPRIRVATPQNENGMSAATSGIATFELRAGKQRQQLPGYGFSALAEGQEQLSRQDYLLWAGDLDGDGKPDLILNHGDLDAGVALYLSSLAKDGELVGLAGSFRYFDPSSAGC